MEIEANSAVCTRCGMPIGYDVALFGESGTGGLCKHCASADNVAAPQPDMRWAFETLVNAYHAKDQVAQMVAAVPERREGTVDAMVLFSGGKDSSWMLMNLARRGDLNVKAWMLDQGYQSPQAIRNAQFMCDQLGVELVIAKPDRDPMDTLFRLGFTVNESGDSELIQSAMSYGSACWPCFSTITAQATLYARDHDAAFCFIGTTKGQNRMQVGGETELSHGLVSMGMLMDKFVKPMRRHADAVAPEAASLLEVADVRTILIPFYEFVEKPELEQQLADLTAAGWDMPKNTGACSTNCMMNELGRKIMKNQYGFDSYQVMDANERRLCCSPTPAPIDVIDEDMVQLGAKLIGLTPVERTKFGIDE